MSEERELLKNALAELTRVNHVTDGLKRKELLERIRTYLETSGSSTRTWVGPSANLHNIPKKNKPMTEEEMRALFRSTNTAEPLCEGWPGLERFARAIERNHGIGGGE